MFCRSFFVLFLLAIVLSVILLFMDSDYQFDIFKLLNSDSLKKTAWIIVINNSDNQYPQNKQRCLTSNHWTQKIKKYNICQWKSRTWFGTGTKMWKGL